MKKIAGLIFFLPFLAAHAQQVYSSNEGEVSFFSEAPLENIEARSSNINSYLSPGTKEIAFIIPIRGFRFAKGLMQEHFNEKYMESDKYPNATYKGKIEGDPDLTKNGTYTVSSSGKMNIHGVDRDVSQPGTITVKDNNIVLNCSFRVAVKDYNITIPKLLFQNIADTVTVTMNVHYVPLQKK